MTTIYTTRIGNVLHVTPVDDFFIHVAEFEPFNNKLVAEYWDWFSESDVTIKEG